jgi:RNA polymerase subunit RPABC4/transcription elongation factor Spt4
MSKASLSNYLIWQCCPVCNGKKEVPNYYGYFTVPMGMKQCPVCEGHGIVSIQTGKPPEFTAKPLN